MADQHQFFVGGRVVRISTREVGVLTGLSGSYAHVTFARTGQTTIHIEDIELAPADPVDRLRAGIHARGPEFGLRLLARYLQFAYRYDPLSGLSNARIEPTLHQVFVAHRVNQKLSPRMILADEVGLGKTIEAGLIMKEQIARGLADRILIVCPASLQYQWQYELSSKFNVDFVIVDGPTVRLFERGGSNPWSKADKVITSINLARREDRALQITEAPWDIVVFDEAHHVRRRYEGPDRWRTTQIYRLADELKELVDGLLLLTATPMQLHPFELYSLIELVDPGLFPSFEAYERQRQSLPELNSLMRILQSWEALSDDERSSTGVKHGQLLRSLGMTGVADLETPAVRTSLMDGLTSKHPLTGTLVRNRKALVGGFTKRVPLRRLVPLKTDEEEVYREVEEYLIAGYNRALAEKNNAVGFLMVLYQKILASSSNALRASFKSRVEKLTDQLERADAWSSGAMTMEDLAEIEGDDDVDAAIDKLSAISANREAAEWEIRTLERLVAMLGRTRDSKAEELIYDLIGRILEVDPNEKILVFTGFIKTQEFLAQALQSAGYTVAVFNGQMNLEEKEDAVRRFRQSTQVMVTTEAGGEGRNFQFAHIMVNYDLPWNPMKVEQRIGRLDRIGQKRNVQIYNLACEGTVEERVLELLETRIGLFEESVGSLDPILGEVEHDIERIVMENMANREARLDDYGSDLEQRVKEAREKERVLADFILDRASLRHDQAAELLDDQPLATWQDLKQFVSESLDYMGGRVSQHSEGGYSVSLSPNLSGRLGMKNAVSRGEFDPRAALRMEEIDFFAFGHDLVDRVVERAAEFEASTGARLVTGGPSEWSLEVIYEMQSEGVRPSGRWIRHVVGRDLDLIQERLEAAPELGTPSEAPTPVPWLDEALAASDKAIQAAQNELREQVWEENETIRTQELEREAQVFGYQRERLQRVIAEGESWISEKERVGSPGDLRILPARRGKLARDRARLSTLEQEHRSKIAEIGGRRADVSRQLVAIGFVKAP